MTFTTFFTFTSISVSLLGSVRLHWTFPYFRTTYLKDFLFLLCLSQLSSVNPEIWSLFGDFRTLNTFLKIESKSQSLIELSDFNQLIRNNISYVSQLVREDRHVIAWQLIASVFELCFQTLNNFY